MKEISGGIMKRLVSITKDPNIKVKSTITEFLSPDYIYLPIEKNDKLFIQKKNIQKNEVLFQQQEKVVSSPVSGTIEKIIPRKNYLEEEKTFLKIKNDFQENDDYKGSSTTTIIIRTDITKKIKESFKSSSKFTNKKRLLLNGIEDEPYLANNLFCHKLHTMEILLMLDAISTAYNINEVIIALKEIDRESIEAFEQYINTYPNIKIQILPDYYPLENEKIFKEYNYLTEEDVVIKTEEILNFYYEKIKFRKKDFLYVTLTGSAVKNPQVVKVKIGTVLKDVVEELLELEPSYEVYVNGIMNGVSSKVEDIILTEEIRGIYFMKEKKEATKPCIHCGKCNQICPMKCNPYQKILTKGKQESPDCIHCGLCTFICPSFIDFELIGKESNHEK